MKVWKFLSICSVVLGLSVAVFAQSAADDALSTEVDDVVRAQMHEQKIPGVSLAVIRDGKIIKAAGYGLANVELNVPMAPQMVFHSGSLAKAFTATAVMMLVEEGKIGLDDKISKYLPDAPTLWNEVTIRALAYAYVGDSGLLWRRRRSEIRFPSRLYRGRTGPQVCRSDYEVRAGREVE